SSRWHVRQWTDPLETPSNHPDVPRAARLAARFHFRTSFAAYSGHAAFPEREAVPDQIQSLIANLRSFGPKRLAMLGGVGAAVIAIILTASTYLNRPSFETLYVGLDRNDVGQIGIALAEAGIRYDVSSEGTSVLVPVGSTGQARMLLAERGLPTSSNAGYELFDNVGSFGLTSF